MNQKKNYYAPLSNENTQTIHIKDKMLSIFNSAPPLSQRLSKKDQKSFYKHRSAQHVSRILCNPTRIQNPFWEYIIENGEDPFEIKKMYGLERHYSEPAIFTFAQRFGRTITKLPDNRVVFIGGEHEDCYDPNFFIYNDVVVASDMGNVTFDKDDFDKLSSRNNPRNFEIYNYPSDIFPATDFHTATLVENLQNKSFIYIIGGLGYIDSEHRKQTLTHRLCLETMKMEVVDTKGVRVPPLCNNLYDFQAILSTKGDPKITITAKTNIKTAKPKEIFKGHECEYTLDLNASVWTMGYDKIEEIEEIEKDEEDEIDAIDDHEWQTPFH